MALILGELQKVVVIAESLMVNVITAERWATWRKIVRARKSMLKVMFLLPVQRRIRKLIGMLYHVSLRRKKNQLFLQQH